MRPLGTPTGRQRELGVPIWATWVALPLGGVACLDRPLQEAGVVAQFCLCPLWVDTHTHTILGEMFVLNSSWLCWFNLSCSNPFLVLNLRLESPLSHPRWATPAESWPSEQSWTTRQQWCASGATWESPSSRRAQRPLSATRHGSWWLCPGGLSRWWCNLRSLPWGWRVEKMSCPFN